MNTDNFLIDNADIEFAQSICSVIKDPYRRERAMANAIAATIASKYFDADKFEIDTSSCLHNIGKVLEDIDISDIYVNNNYIDVRVFFKEDEMCIPRAHIVNELLPTAYMFIKISSDLSNAEVLGFFKPAELSHQNLQEEYIRIRKQDLVSFYEVEKLLKYVDKSYSINDKDLFNYLDNNYPNKIQLYTKLIRSKYAREKLAKLYKAKTIFNLISSSIDDFEFDNGNVESSQVSGVDNDNQQTEQGLEGKDDAENRLQDASDESDLAVITKQAAGEDASSTQGENTVNSNPDNQVAAVSNKANNGSGQIDKLFGNDISNNAEYSYPAQKKKSSVSPFVLFALIVIIIVVGVCWYFMHMTSLVSHSNRSDISNVDVLPIQEQTPKIETPKVAEAMPNETIIPSVKENNNEASSVTIPAIEQNLDASVLVSNLKIEWKVPPSYSANVPAKRYLTKLGKIIQLNLKTELLLLNKPPISNQITVEIRYNANSQKFETAGINMSSGEGSVDDLILKTVNKALTTNINVNKDSFSKLQGNPVLVIHL